MKKPTATLPSTKPDHLYSSQQSQASLLVRPRNYQQQLSTLLITLRSTNKFRYYMLFRDLEAVFTVSQVLLTDLLGVTSAEELWRMFAGQGQEELHEQEQIGFLLRILLELNNRKHAEADSGNIASFDNFRAAIQWLIPQIVSFEAEIRLKLEEQLLQTCEKQKQRRQSQFRRYDQGMRQKFEAMQLVRKENLAERLHKETQAKNAQFLQKIKQGMNKIRASSQLKNAKETALLRKMAPYRWEKKRPYEDDTYRKELQQDVEQDQNRRTRAIQQMKRVQKEKLRRAQATLVSTHNMYSQTMREKLNSQLNSQGSALRNHEEQALRNLRHSVDIANNHRVNSLKKSLQAFSRHQDTLKIKQILQDHNNKAQFCNTIEDAVQPQSHIQKLDSRYCTILTDRAANKMDEVVHHHQRRLKRHINVILGESQQRDQSSGRKSLAQLYDKSMNLVQQ